jgi:ADP-ribose pyrophosphatase YjhB (NUDIX family)
VKRPKKLLVELPTADEIDALAMSTPDFKVRKFEFQHHGEKADLNYVPCKGQVLLVIRGQKGVALIKRKGSKDWTLPSGRIRTYEELPAAVKRVAKRECGLGISSMDLTAMYDVVWHHEDVSIKRLCLVYSALTDDLECRPETSANVSEAAFHKDGTGPDLKSEMDRAAIDDAGEK